MAALASIEKSEALAVLVALRTKYSSISAKYGSNPEFLRNSPLPGFRQGKLKGGQDFE